MVVSFGDTPDLADELAKLVVAGTKRAAASLLWDYEDQDSIPRAGDLVVVVGLGVCYLDGEDIEAVMMRRGLARDCPRYSGGQHVAAERQAGTEGATIGRTYPLLGYRR